MNRGAFGGFLLIDDISEAFYGWRTFQIPCVDEMIFRGFLNIEDFADDFCGYLHRTFTV